MPVQPSDSERLLSFSFYLLDADAQNWVDCVLQSMATIIIHLERHHFFMFHYFFSFPPILISLIYIICIGQIYIPIYFIMYIMYKIPTYFWSFLLKKYFIYLFLEKGMGGRKRRRETSMCERSIDWLLLSCAPNGDWLSIQACALTRNWTSDLLFCRTIPDQLSCAGQGLSVSYFFFQSTLFFTLVHIAVSHLYSYFWLLHSVSRYAQPLYVAFHPLVVDAQTNSILCYDENF